MLSFSLFLCVCVCVRERYSWGWGTEQEGNFLHSLSQAFLRTKGLGRHIDYKVEQEWWGGSCTHTHGTTMRTHKRKCTRSAPLFSLMLLPNPTPPHKLTAALKSLYIPKLLVKRTKLENKTVRLTNKITCCLHLAVAIKALMTSEDGLLMWCLKAYQRFHNKIAPHVPLWQRCQLHSLSFFGPLCCLLYSVMCTPGICYIEIFIIKTVAEDAAMQVTLVDLKSDLADPIGKRQKINRWQKKNVCIRNIFHI